MHSHVEGSSRTNEWINRSARGRGTGNIWACRIEKSQGRVVEAYICAQGVYNVAPFVCPVNYSRSKLSGNEVLGSSLGLSHLPSPSSTVLLARRSASHLCGLTLKERERTNKSARAVRRDIVSCKVNHLRGSKTASSPRKNPLPRPSLLRLSTTLEASRRRLLPPLPPCTPVFYSTRGTANHRHLFPFYLSSLLLLLLSYPSCFPSSWSVQLASICGHMASSLASSDP